MGRFRIAILGLTAALLVTPVSAFEFPTLRQPTWQELSPQQKQVLAPLSEDWDRMEDARRKKWVSIAARYPHLTPEEQARIQSQMQEWAKLTPQQRQRVRDKYKALKKAPAGTRQALREQWELYQQLPPEEKQRLQEEAAQRKAEARREAQEKSRQATSILSNKVLMPGYASIPVQQLPAPVITVSPVPVPAPAASFPPPPIPQPPAASAESQSTVSSPAP